MKAPRFCCIAAALGWIPAFVYLQLSILPTMRTCLLEKAGVTVTFSGAFHAIGGCANTALLYIVLALAILSAILLACLLKNFTGIYDYLREKRKEWVIAAVVAAAAALPYLSRGNVVLGDAMQFSALSVFMKEAVATASYPYWTFYWYLGSAPLAFYGWLYFLVSGIANMLMNIDLANKLVFFLSHVGSALLAYKLIKMTSKSSKAAIIGALAFGLSFEHIARIMFGRSIVSLNYLLTPLLFIILELRLNKRLGSYKAIALLAAISSLLMFNHPVESLFIIAVFIVYAASRALEAGKDRIKQVAFEIAAGLAIALTIVSFWAVPMLLESGEASGTGKLVDVIMPKLPSLNMAKDMVLWPGKFGDKPMFYVGLSALALAATGIYSQIRQKKTAIAVATIISFALLLLQSSRYAPVFLLMVAMAAGQGFIFLASLLKIDSRKLLLIIGLIMIVDMVPATVQLGYPDFGYNKAFYDTINASAGERVLDLSTDRRTFWPAYVYLNNKAETVFGTVIESAPNSLPYAAAITGNAAREFYDLKQNFSEESLQGMYLLGVKHVILHNEQVGKNPEKVFNEKRGTLGLERGLESRQLDNSLIIAAPKKSVITYEPLLETKQGWDIRPDFEKRSINFSEVRQSLELMQLDRAKATARQILVKGGENENATTNENISIEVQSVKTMLNKVEIKYSVSEEAFLQISYSYSPRLSIKIDGTEAEYWKTAINTVAVRTQKGQHTITLEGKQSSLRRNLLFVSAAGIILAALLFRKKASGELSQART